jgi:hypothetical protein
MADPTPEQRKAIRSFIDSTLLPLIGDVLEKKLSQAALFMRDELNKPFEHWKCSNKDHGEVFTEYHGGRCPTCAAAGLHWSLYSIGSSAVPCGVRECPDAPRCPCFDKQGAQVSPCFKGYGIDGPRHGPEADGSQKPNDAAAIPCAKAGSNPGVPGNQQEGGNGS